MEVENGFRHERMFALTTDVPKAGERGFEPRPRASKAPVLASYTTPQRTKKDTRGRYAGAVTDDFTVLVMAAGRGTRMHSSLPKVLHPVCGRPMVQWVIDAARTAGATKVVCVVRRGDGVAEGLPAGVEVAEQTGGEGTGAAVLAAREELDPEAPVIVLSGDHPLLSATTIESLLQSHAREHAAATLLTTDQLDPEGYGRIVRTPDGSVERVVETKDTAGLPPSILAIQEINLGTYAFQPIELLSALDLVEPQNGERYLTGTIPVLRAGGKHVATHLTADTLSALGVNSRIGLMEAEQLAQRRIVERHALAGVSFLSPETVRVEAEVEIGGDTTIAPGVTLCGSTRVGSGCHVGPQTTLIDTIVGDHARLTHSHLVGSEVRPHACVGPFATGAPGQVFAESADEGAGARSGGVGDGAYTASGNPVEEESRG